MSNIYVVKGLVNEKADKTPRLVRADTKSAAIKHVIAGRITAEIPTPDELVELVQAGVKVEDEAKS